MEQALENLLNIATNSCCTFGQTVTYEEADAILEKVSSVVPTVAETLNIVRNKKPQFDALMFATSIIRTDIKKLHTHSNILNECLIEAMPSGSPSHLFTAFEYSQQINSAFELTKTHYNIAL